MANSTLAAIRTKVRRLTRSPSPSQLSDADIDQYVNTFIQYDFPENIRLANLLTTFEFFTEPYVDVYETSSNPSSPLYQFKQKYLTVHPPIYIAGYQALFCESREKFFGIYPTLNSIQSIGTTGNGVQTQFSGTISNVTNLTMLLRNNVLFSSMDINGNGLAMIDYPINSVEGNLYVPGGAPTSTTVPDPNNYINYTSGIYVVTFPTAPNSGQTINSQTIPLQMGLPRSILFYDGKFTVRPVPDQPYRINMEVFIRPTELLVGSDKPQLEEWWQYIAFGCARKVFQDRMDMESLANIEPEFEKQECLMLRRTIVQQTSQRTATIYTQDQGTSDAYGPGLWSGGGTL